MATISKRGRENQRENSAAAVVLAWRQPAPPARRRADDPIEVVVWANGPLVPFQLDLARIMGSTAYAVPKGGQHGQLRAAASADARGAPSVVGEGQGSATGGPAARPVSGHRRGRERLLGRRGGRSCRLQR